jgi:predicted acylesterase/phospholipase RssA
MPENILIRVWSWSGGGARGSVATHKFVAGQLNEAGIFLRCDSGSSAGDLVGVL